MAKSAAAYYEVRWRIQGSDEAWSAPQRVNPASEVVVEGLDRTKAYEFEARAVSNCGAKSDWAPSADHTVPGAPAGTLTLADLKAEADHASSDAAAANAQLADIASDNLLTPGEKPIVIRDWNVISAEQTGIDAQATAYGITTEKAAYDGKVTALTAYLGTLTSPAAWNDLGGNTTIVGANFRQAFADVYTTRQTLLNAIYAAAKAKADAAQATANTATGQVSQLPVINGGFDMSPTGYGWTADGGSGWTIDTASNTPGVGPNSAKHAGGAGSGAYRNSGLAACLPGQVYKAQGLIKAVGADGACWVYISWCNAAGGEIGNTAGNQVTGSTTAGSYVVGTAPAGTVYARTCIGVASHTTGTYYVDNVLCSQYPSSVDEMNDGTKYARVAANQVKGGVVSLLGTGRSPIVNGNFAQNFLGLAAGSGLQSGMAADGWQITSAYPSTGAVIHYAAGIASRVLQNYPLPVGFSNAPYIASMPFAVVPNATYALKLTRSATISGPMPSGVNVYHRVYMEFSDATGTVVSNNVYDLAITGSGDLSGVYTGTVPSTAISCRILMGLLFNNTGAFAVWPFGSSSYYGEARLDSVEYVQSTDLASEVKGTLSTQRNLPLVTWGNYGGGWSGLSIPYTTTTTSCTFTPSAASFVGGGDSIPYNASSLTVSGTAGSTVTYYLYYDDPGMTGGSKSLQATTNQITSLNANGRVLVGTVKVTYPTSGTGGGTGGGSCPQVDEPVIRRAPDGSEEVIRAGDVRCGDHLLLSSGRWGLVTYSEAKQSPGVRVVGADGSSLACSSSAPLETADGPCVLAPYVRGLVLKHRRTGVMRVADVLDAGEITVQHITCENDCFWVADYSHHNRKPDQPP